MEILEEEAILTQLQETVDSDPNNPSHHYNLGILLWQKGGESREKSVEHFVVSAKLNPNNGAVFRFLGHYYSQISVDTQRASKCYQRAVTLNPDDFEAGEAFSNLLDDGGKENLEVVVCQEASQKSPKAFWAFRRLGYLQVHQKKWIEAVQSLQHAIRGYPACADLWETLGFAYQRLGMFSAALKSYGRALELEDSRVLALVESGNISLQLGSFRKGIEQFRQALEISPQNVAAQYGLASGLLGLSKECMQYGAFGWGASLLKEASDIVKASTGLTGSASCVWKLHGDIQLAYAKCCHWTDEHQGLGNDEEALKDSIISWKRNCCAAATSAIKFYQRALHLTPWQANFYVDIAISADFICALEMTNKPEPYAWQLSEKMSLGGLSLEGGNSEFWLALGCLSCHSALRQHAFIRGLQLDASLAVAWAHLGKLYRKEGEKQLTGQAFDHARSIDPSLALPWAGMSADTESRLDEAYESCLRAVQILPLAEFQIGLGKLAVISGNLLSPQVFGAIKQAVQRAPHYPESHNLYGLVCEARSDYQSAVAAYQRARCAFEIFAGSVPKFRICDISINLARSLCLAGNALAAAHECEGLEKEGLLDTSGLQIYAVSLWKLGENEQALSVARRIAKNVSTMDPTTAATSICLICKLMYCISGLDSIITSIMKLPRELLKSSKISFIISVIDALDHTGRLNSVVLSTRSSFTSHEEITGMHSLTALSKLVKNASKESLGIDSGVVYLRKALHMYPNSSMMRNQLAYLLLSDKRMKDTCTLTRCIIIDPPGRTVSNGLRSAYEILGAAGSACYANGTTSLSSFPTCIDQFSQGVQTRRELQRWLRQEPWNPNARYLLILNILHQAREVKFPRHLCVTLERLVYAALSQEVYSKKDPSYSYQRFQLLLCISEIRLQGGDHVGSINYAIDASSLSLSKRNLYFAHLLLCRVYASQGEFLKSQEEYMKCLQLKTYYPIGWICLKIVECRYKLQVNSNALDLMFEECVEGSKGLWNFWMAIFEFVRGQSFILDQDFLHAKEALANSCSLASTESCLLLCHGAVCMELARQQCGNSQFLQLAVKHLSKAQLNAPIPIPIVSALLGQAQANLGAKEKWKRNIRIEWFSWPEETRPAELYFEMHLLARQHTPGSDSSSTVELCQSPLNWLLRAIHLNPSCSRYWKLLDKARD